MEAIIRKIVHYIKNNENISNPFVKFIFNKKYHATHQIVKIEDLKNCEKERIKNYFSASRFTSWLPRFDTNNPPKSIVVKSPETALFQFKNAIVDADSTAIMYLKKLRVCRYNDERYNEGFVQWHDTTNAKIKISPTEKINSGFFLGGNGSWNWYHFLVEIAPKLLLFDTQLETTILVSETVIKYPSMQKILNLINDNANLIYLNKNQLYEVNKLWYINDFNHVQFNRFDDEIKSDGTYFNAELTQKFSDKILQSIKLEPKTAENIFLYRKNTHRIAKNQDLIVDFLSQYNYKAICLEELDLEKQISYFYHAKSIIGISGAAWANLIFCRNQPKAICFLPKNAKEFAAFSNLAQIFDVELISQLYDNDEKHTQSNFEIDFMHFKKIFSKLHTNYEKY